MEWKKLALEQPKDNCSFLAINYDNILMAITYYNDCFIIQNLDSRAFQYTLSKNELYNKIILWSYISLPNQPERSKREDICEGGHKIPTALDDCWDTTNHK